MRLQLLLCSVTAEGASRSSDDQEEASLLAEAGVTRAGAEAWLLASRSALTQGAWPQSIWLRVLSTAEAAASCAAALEAFQHLSAEAEVHHPRVPIW